MCLATAAIRGQKPVKNQELKLILVQERRIRSAAISLIFVQY